MAMNTTTAQTQPSTTPQKMVVTVPVADVRTEPKAPAATVKLPICSADNPLQETQLLYGEHILGLEEIDGWIRIQAMEQQKNRNGVWQGYPGWIRKDQAMAVEAFPAYNLVVTKQWTSVYDEKQTNPIITVSIGTKFKGVRTDKDSWTVALHDGSVGHVAAADVYEITKTVGEDEKTMRKQVVANALPFEKASYSWGGRSASSNNLLISSVDCSGLTNLTHRAMGLEIPRDAHDQFLQANVIQDGTSMQPGDLIFLAPKEKPNRMRHVMMYIGNEQLIEATYFDGIDHTHITAVAKKLGKPIAELKNGQECGHVIVHLGSLLGSKEIVSQLRAQALKTTYN
jgi:cell wall-associated NlpC family hydrolase